MCFLPLLYVCHDLYMNPNLGVSRVLPHQAEVKVVGVWLCVNLLCVYF